MWTGSEEVFVVVFSCGFVVVGDGVDVDVDVGVVSAFLYFGSCMRRPGRLVAAWLSPRFAHPLHVEISHDEVLRRYALTTCVTGCLPYSSLQTPKCNSI